MVSAQAPDEDASEHIKKQEFSFDTVIVFGQGPIKPVLLESELTSEEKIAWYRHKNDPTRNPEPQFWLVQQPKQLAELEKISQDGTLTYEEKAQRKEILRQKWQRTGWFAMKHWCRQNALAAGLALYKGYTKRIILSGGKTIKKKYRQLLPQERLEQWPSEARLMEDTIRATYGELFFKKYGHSIDEHIHIEDASTNTLENFACTVNKFPELIDENIKVGFLAVEHHLERVAMFGELFSIKGGKLCAQKLLHAMQIEEELKDSENKTYIEQTKKLVEDVEIVSQEPRWKKGVQEPAYVKYWLGYVALAKHPKVLHNVMRRLQDPDWMNHAKSAFDEVGLDMNEYCQKDLVQLAKQDSVKFTLLMQRLQELRKPEYRIAPPQITV